MNRIGTTDFVWIVRRNDPLDPEIDVFADFDTAQRFAEAIDGTATEEPLLGPDDVYVEAVLADGRFQCDTCGRIGNNDDGIGFDGDDCPADDCDGTVHRLREEVK